MGEQGKTNGKQGKGEEHEGKPMEHEIKTSPTRTKKPNQTNTSHFSKVQPTDMPTVPWTFGGTLLFVIHFCL